LQMRRAQSNGVRPLEGAFSGIAMVLAIHVLFSTIVFAAQVGVLPRIIYLVSSSPAFRVGYVCCMIVAGVLLLFSVYRRFKRLYSEMALTGLYARYRYMIEADPRAILLFQTDDKLVEINRVGREWMNGSSSVTELHGQPILEVLKRLQPDNPEELLERLLRRETIEIRLGDRIISDCELAQLVDEEGISAGRMLCMRDVTEDKKFQKEIIQSEKLAVVGQLAAATAHEIRNPLTSIKGFLQLQEQRLKGNQHESEMMEYTRIMVEEVDRMEKIIRDFLLMTKPSDVTREQVDLNAVIERMLVLVQNQATLRNINVETAFMPLPHVLMHKEAIQQVILNLLQNAFEAMNIGGTLTLKTYEEVKYVAVVVIDTGVGMTDEEIANLGSPFYSTKTEGTGLGLTVSSKIIREHGGVLDVDSVKGVGTTITIKLPK
ncbi:MAG: two-component system sensor histidine kinase NtrB, partial [Tumebacillaceae bacterium]